MGEVKKADFGHDRQRVYEDENCAGCKRELEEGEKIQVIELPYKDYDKYISLCMKCYGSAKEHGVF